ncbi:TPA: ATP-binding protein, partial [Staphylococcus aureus]|nr:ATP-binding protein [Staphylococcus aureus]HCZ2826972.1 ATP-binding protein [Staphylococcus aureus]
IAHNLELFQAVQDYRVTQVSLMRGKFHKTVREQFHRIIKGQAVLTSYEFQFKKEDIKIDFQVNPNSNPPSNLHGIIGSNGVGKTRLLKDILNGFLDSQANYIINKDSKNSFYDDNIFTNALFISFSIFDTLEINQTQNKNFSYIGVKKNIDENGSKRNSNKNNDELADEFVNSIREIYNRNDESSERWSRFIEVLGLKNLFFELNKSEDNKKSFKRQFNKLSSGQKIVVLSITKMVERVVEKTLILLDEPELYLHPPLLASYMKVISTLLTEQNGVGIISTHSPVVMQELGKSNVNMIKSSDDNIYITKPRLETYGENLGTLTREVFGFEIENT